MPKLVRITTVAVSLKVLLKGQMKFMRSKGFDVTMISSPGAEVKALEIQEGSPHTAIELTRKITPIQDLRSLIKLVRELRRLRPEIVHTHTPKAGLIGMWAAWFARVPVRMHTIAGIPWMESRGPLRMLLKQVERLTALPALRVYPNSRMLEQFLRSENIATNKLKVLGKGSSNGIDTRHFSISNELSEQAAVLRTSQKIDGRDWVWIFIGRLVKDKGLGELLDAFETIQKQFPGDRLWLLGNEEPDLDPFGERHRMLLKAHPAIKAWGFQDDVRPYLAAAQVLAFPSYREGFPNVPMQAGLLGCMLLLSDINGCNEIVDHGENGFLVPPANAAALTESMLAIRVNQQLRDTFAARISEKIRANYDQQVIWELLLNEYNYWLTETKQN